MANNGPASSIYTNAITKWSTPVAFAELPTTNVPVGARAFIYDSNVGAGGFSSPVTAGGVNLQSCFWDGSIWRLG